jgi:segregation and condensation protein A
MQQLETIADSVPKAAQFRIQLPDFEGPLDLLLHLIKKHELDILDLPIAFVTQSYLDYLRMMQELDLDIAGEYLLMAATLAHIKSKMLLPKAPHDQQEDAAGEEQLDPRLELMRRLLEYQKYKAAAEALGARPVAGRDVFGRGLRAIELQGPPPLADVAIFSLLDAFQGILDRAKDRSAFEITAERMSIQERMAQMTDLLRERRNCVFQELFAADVTRFQIVITFMALLELTKVRIVRVYQADHTSDIHVSFALLDVDVGSVPPPAETTATASAEPPPAPMPLSPDASSSMSGDAQEALDESDERLLAEFFAQAQDDEDVEDGAMPTAGAPGGAARHDAVVDAEELLSESLEELLTEYSEEPADIDRAADDHQSRMELDEES